MSTTTSQDRQFKEIIGKSIEVTISMGALDEAIEYISQNLNPQDVFSAKDLEGWALDNGYIIPIE